MFNWVDWKTGPLDRKNSSLFSSVGYWKSVLVLCTENKETEKSSPVQNDIGHIFFFVSFQFEVSVGRLFYYYPPFSFWPWIKAHDFTFSVHIHNPSTNSLDVNYVRNVKWTGMVHRMNRIVYVIRIKIEIVKFYLGTIRIITTNFVHFIRIHQKWKRERKQKKKPPKMLFQTSTGNTINHFQIFLFRIRI